MNIQIVRSACNPAISFTLFQNLQTPQGQKSHTDWRALCQWIEAIEPASVKESQPLIKLATFIDDYRSGQTLERVYGIEGDYDGGRMLPQHAATILQAAGIEALVYTTAQHTTEHPRWRVLAPLEAPTDVLGRGKFVKALDSALGGNVLASESYTAAQAYFVGGIVKNPQQCWRVNGRCLDSLTLVANSPVLQTQRRRSAGKLAPNYAVALDALRSRHPADLNRNEWLVFSGAFHTATATLASHEVRERDWATWNAAYALEHPTYDATADLRVWLDFAKGGTEGDFTTLAMMSGDDNAKGWALFGGIPHIASTISSTKTISKFRLIRESDLRTCSIDWLVDRIIPEGGLSLFFGPSGSCKTFGALSLGLSIAAGLPWLGHTVHQGDVIYVCGEGKSGIRKRIQAWKKEAGQEDSSLPFFISGCAVDFANVTTIDAIKETVADMGVRPKLIIIDTLSRNTSGDENDSKEMAGFIKALDVLKDTYAASILLVHHTGHAEKDRARGSSVLRAAMDSEFRFEKTDSAIKFTCTKMKDTDEPKPIILTLKQIPVQGDGFPEMGAVLVAAGTIPLKLSAQNQAAFNILKSHNFTISHAEFSRKLVDSEITKAEKENIPRTIIRILAGLKGTGALSEGFEFIEALDGTDSSGQAQDRAG